MSEPTNDTPATAPAEAPAAHQHSGGCSHDHDHSHDHSRHAGAGEDPHSEPDTDEEKDEDMNIPPVPAPEFDGTEEIVEMHMLRLAHVENFHLERFPNIKTVSLHRNLIHKLTPLPDNCLNITHLDVSDNKIKHIPDHVQRHQSLTKLDFSYNNIRRVENLAPLTGLTELFLQGNKITQLGGVDTLVNLVELEVGANRIREIQNIATLTKVERLFMGKNKIPQIKNLDTLVNIRILSLQANRLTKVENLGALVNLEELYLSENGIEHIEGLKGLKKLRILDLAVNKIATINTEEMEDQKASLEEFWFNSNKVSDWHEVPKLQAFPGLTCVYLEHNPIFSDVRYRPKVLDILPKLQELDSIPVFTR